MTGSWLGRSLLAMPAMLAAVGVGTVVVGLTGTVSLGLLVTVVLAVLGGLRASRTGVTIDVERHQIVLRTFWRTHRVDAAALQRVEALDRSSEGTAGVRFLLRDGREYGSLALAFLATGASDRLVTDLGSLTVDDPFEVAITPRGARRAAS
jgi:hypothetical protein